MIVRLLRGEAAADRGIDVAAALAEQLLALVNELCAAQPTILVIDDLQWADQASVTSGASYARSVRQVPLLLIGMMRPVPTRDDLLALRRATDDDARIRLTGLAEPAVADLVAALAAVSQTTTCCGSQAVRPATRSTSPNWSPRWRAVQAWPSPRRGRRS